MGRSRRSSAGARPGWSVTPWRPFRRARGSLAAGDQPQGRNQRPVKRDGALRQRRLLQKEGIRFDRKGRVNLKKVRWAGPDLSGSRPMEAGLRREEGIKWEGMSKRKQGNWWGSAESIAAPVRNIWPRGTGISRIWKKHPKNRVFPFEEIRCDGCLSDNVFPSCRDCRHGFRRCAEEHKVTWCFQCREFPCPRLRSFLPIHVVNGVSHHARLIEELEYLQAHGIEKWVEKQDNAGRCPHCRKVLYWYARECPACQFPIERPLRGNGK